MRLLAAEDVDLAATSWCCYICPLASEGGCTACSTRNIARPSIAKLLSWHLSIDHAAAETYQIALPVALAHSA